MVKIASNEVVYLSPGSVVQGQLYVSPNANNVTIRGRGILCGVALPGQVAQRNTAPGHMVAIHGATHVYVEGIIIIHHFNLCVYVPF